MRGEKEERLNYRYLKDGVRSDETETMKRDGEGYRERKGTWLFGRFTTVHVFN